MFFTLSAYSQEPIETKTNLDFEILEARKAQGWDDFGNKDYIKGIDSSVSRSGKYSTFIESKKGATTFGAVSYAIPADFTGKKIKLAGFIKTKNVKGFAGLWMRVEPKVTFYNMHDRGVTGTTEWQKYEIELDYDQRAEKIVIGGLLSGKGKMWLDDLEVTIDGQKLESFEKKSLLSPELKKSLLKQIEQHKINLNLSAGKQLETSLQPLIELIGEKKIVAIGEDTHGTSDYYKLRETITKKLIMEKGFNVVVLENPYDDIEKFVKDIDSESVNTLMRKHLFSIYQTEEMKSFLDWYNTDEIKNNVQFKGSDDSYWLLPQLLEEQLLTFNDEKIVVLVEKLKDAANLTVEEYNKKYSVPDQEASNSNQLGVFTYEAAIALEKYLISQGLLNKKLEENLFNLKTTYLNFLNLRNKKPIQSRDEMMAQRIAYLAKDPNSKIIVWAHNAHISNIEIIDGEIGLMGENLKEEFGKNYHSIGLSSFGGSYSYVKNRFINDDHSYDDKLRKAQLNSQPDTSWEKIFKEIGQNAFFVNTDNFSKTDITENLKLLGYGQEKSTDYYKLPLLKMFDTVLFINSTKSTTPLFN